MNYLAHSTLIPIVLHDPDKRIVLAKIQTLKGDTIVLVDFDARRISLFDTDLQFAWEEG